ncbi:MAG: Fic family protein [Chloroflexi bacterium]|nr:Fic family protein [Chloroflexota bacterium]
MNLKLTYDTSDHGILDSLALLESRLYTARTLIPEGYEPFFRQSARYESAHTSTAIEGNVLDRDAAMAVLREGADPDQPPELEIVNLSEAYELMASLAEDKSTRIDQGIIRTMNSMVLKGLPGAPARNRGRYRVGPSLIVDASTRAVRYRPPQPQWVPDLMATLADNINVWLDEAAGPVAAALAHFGIVSVHPFEDGNGRTARLVADMVLNLKDSSADGMISTSKAFYNELPGYYQALRDAQGENFREEVDATAFVRYHTDALATAATNLEDAATHFGRILSMFEQDAAHVMNERQANGLMFMSVIGPISTSRYATLTESSQATALSDLGALVEAGYVMRLGSGKLTRYDLSDDVERRLTAAIN